MPIFKNWFEEKQIPGKREKNIKHRFLIQKKIYLGKTNFQKVFIFKNPLYGRIFCLDDIVQFSEIDEFVYHEMMVHPLFLSHPAPKEILIIGGGDGGVLREVLKYPIKKVDLVEIDKKIPEIAQKYLFFVCKNSFFDKRVKIYNQPAQDFVKKLRKNLYDILIIDCTNPYPYSLSFSLYSQNFLKKTYKILKENGILITLGYSFLDFYPALKKTFKKLRKIFRHSHLIRFTMPSYHCGDYCFFVGSKKIDLEKVNLENIKRRYNRLNIKTKYYLPSLHFSYFLLPPLYYL